MPEAKLDYTWEEVMRDGREYTLELTISVDWSPFIPAKTNCDPEDGHPAEGGDFEVTEVTLLSVQQDGVSDLGNSVAPPHREKWYWETRFRREVQFTDHFRDWLGEQISDEERGANEPEDDDR